MDVTLLPPTTILANHSHLTLLPSALPRNPNSRRPCHLSTHHFDTFCSYKPSCKRTYEPRPPLDGSSPLSSLPDEVILSIFSWVDFEDLLSLRQTSRRLALLAVAPSLHRSLTLTTLPPTPLPNLLTQHLLPPLRHLHLHLFPYPLRPPSSQTHPSVLLLSLLRRIPHDQLLSLSLPFSAPYLSPDDLCSALQQSGRKLQKLDLRGSALAGDRWASTFVGMKDLRHVDFGFTNISALPTSEGLESLSLASCPSLPARSLEEFLSHLPSTLQRLDLSRLDQIPFEALWQMKVVHEVGGVQRPTQLREIKVVGIDHLTRRDVRSLKKHWEDQRRSSLETACSLTSATAKPLPIPEARYNLQGRRSDGRHSYLLSPPGTPDSFGGATSSPSGSSLLSSPYTPATSISGSLSPPSLKSPLPHRHPYLSSFSGIPTPPSSVSPPMSAGLVGDAIEEYDAISVTIIHSAILESEDEDGYRRFIGEVAGATVGADWNEGTEGGRDYVEIDA